MVNAKKFYLIGIGTLILSIIGFYNGYPLVTSDTGTYIMSGFDLFVPTDRPVTYGLFLRFFSMETSAWLVVLTQNLITAFVLHEFLTIFFQDKLKFKRIYLSLLVFLLLLTGIGWYTNQLMPDFFAPIVFLAFYTLLFKEGPGKFSKCLLGIILLFALVTHFSHLLMGTIILITLITAKVFFKRRSAELTKKKIIGISALVVAAWLFVPSVNYMIDKKFVLSKGSHVFLMAHLNDTGILEKFLQENCSEPEYENCKLCTFKDSLPQDLSGFLWKTDIIKRTGGWEGSKKEYNMIINGTLKQPKYLMLNIQRSTLYGLIQLTQNKIGFGLTPYLHGTPPYIQIRKRFPDESNNYLNSRQQRWKGYTLDLSLLNTLQTLLLIFCATFLLLLFTGKHSSELKKSSKNVVVFAILFICLNSFITAGLNSPCDRFQARVVWLFPLSFIILLIQNRKLIFSSISERINKKS